MGNGASIPNDSYATKEPRHKVLIICRLNRCLRSNTGEINLIHGCFMFNLLRGFVAKFTTEGLDLLI